MGVQERLNSLFVNVFKAKDILENLGKDVNKITLERNEAVDILKSLSKRHSWQSDLGDCICESHLRANEFLNRTELK